MKLRMLLCSSRLQEMFQSGGIKRWDTERIRVSEDGSSPGPTQHTLPLLRTTHRSPGSLNTAVVCLPVTLQGLTLHQIHNILMSFAPPRERHHGAEFIRSLFAFTFYVWMHQIAAETERNLLIIIKTWRCIQEHVKVCYENILFLLTMVIIEVIALENIWTWNNSWNDATVAAIKDSHHLFLLWIIFNKL